MDFYIDKQVGCRLESALHKQLSDLDRDSRRAIRIEWLTYSISLAEAGFCHRLLRQVRPMVDSMRVICCRPDPSSRPLLSRRAWDLLREPDGLNLEVEWSESLHAKGVFIFAAEEFSSESGSTQHEPELVFAALGSFNLSDSSLSEDLSANTETLIFADPGHVNNSIHSFLSQNFHEVQASQTSGLPAPIPPTKPRPPSQQPDSKKLLELVSSLSELIEERLSNYPSRGETGQRLVVESLTKSQQTQRREGLVFRHLLWLPTGYGKTLIALHWLLGQLKEQLEVCEEAAQTESRTTWCFYLAGHTWATERSVEDQLDSLLQDLHEGQNLSSLEYSRDTLAQYLVVGRSRLLYERLHNEGDRPCAVVADEFHSFDRDYQPERGASYSNLIRDLIDPAGPPPTPLLALTATPCRQTQGRRVVRYSVASFIESIFRSEPSRYLSLPPQALVTMRTLEDAIESKMILDYEALSTAGLPAVEEVRAVFSDMRLRGNYSARTPVLTAWQQLTSGDSLESTLQHLTQALAEHRKSIIFFPMQHEATSDSINDFIERLKSRLEEHSVYDFRTTPNYEDRASLQELRNQFSQFGEAERAVAINCEYLAHGANFPNVDLVVFLRLTLSPVLAIQAFGRGLRLPNVSRQSSANQARLHVLDFVYFGGLLREWRELCTSYKQSLEGARVSPALSAEAWLDSMEGAEDEILTSEATITPADSYPTLRDPDPLLNAFGWARSSGKFREVISNYLQDFQRIPSHQVSAIIASWDSQPVAS